MQFNISTGYAIHILIYLANNMKRIVPSVELSENITVSQRYLLQIAGKLRERGLVGVNKGMTGGYRLLHDPSQINLYDIIEHMEGGMVIPENSGSAAVKNKMLNEAFILLNDYFTTYLRIMTIDRLTDKSEEEEWQTQISNRVEWHIASLNEMK